VDNRQIKQMDEITTGYNSTLAIGGVSPPIDSFLVAESSVLRTNFSAEKTALRQSAKRYAQCYRYAQPTLQTLNINSFRRHFQLTLDNEFAAKNIKTRLI